MQGENWGKNGVRDFKNNDPFLVLTIGVNESWKSIACVQPVYSLCTAASGKWAAVHRLLAQLSQPSFN